MRKFLFLISLALSSAGCIEADDQSAASQAPDNSAVPIELEQPAPPSEQRADARFMSEETPRFSFEYKWPAEASAIPTLAAELERRAATEKAALVSQSDGEWNSARNGDWEPRQHSYAQDWTVVTDLPQFLSLVGRWSAYSGGAHGMHGAQSLIWDRGSGRLMDGVELFRSPAALTRALGNRLCASLNLERAKRRGAPVSASGEGMFENCPPIDEAVVLVGSSNRRTFDRLGIYYGPYVAGSYAEGDFELNLPVDAAVLQAVKPEYRQAFSTGS